MLEKASRPRKVLDVIKAELERAVRFFGMNDVREANESVHVRCPRGG